MPLVQFTQTLQRHLAVPPADVPGETVREALDAVFRNNPALRGYVLDDRGQLRRHVMIFVDGAMIEDRQELGDRVGPDAQLYVMQALSGG